MTPQERLQAAIEKLEALVRLGSDGPWNADRLTAGRATVISNGVGRSVAHYVEENDAERIVTLHRTIDAQLAILRSELDFVARCGWPTQPFPERLAVLALADAIRGSES